MNRRRNSSGRWRLGVGHYGLRHSRNPAGPPVEFAGDPSSKIMDFISSMQGTAPDAMAGWKGRRRDRTWRSGLSRHRRRCHDSSRDRRRSSRNLHAGVCATLRRNVDRRPNQRHRPAEFERAGRSRMLCVARSSALCGAVPVIRSAERCVYGAYCSSCHGATATAEAGQFHRGRLVSRAGERPNLRTTVIAGRPEWALPIGAATCPASRCRRGCLRCRGLACRAAATRPALFEH
jgi:hypothetical protein